MKCSNCGRTCVPCKCKYCFKETCILCKELELHDCPYIQIEIENDMIMLKDKRRVVNT
jgi:hypothetical protein